MSWYLSEVGRIFKVSNYALMFALSYRIDTLFKPTSQGYAHKYYRELYPKIIKDIEVIATFISQFFA